MRTEPTGITTPRLAVLVPYRNRPEHLEQFLPHTLRFLAGQAGLDFTLHVVEQDPAGPFNRGALMNAGALIVGGRADYFCCHDVDYLPLEADYGYPSMPTRLIWHGLRVEEDYDEFFGAVVAFDRQHFHAANGYSNQYPLWGYEDQDLFVRFSRCGLPIGRRDGRFQALLHPQAGVDEKGALLPEVEANRQRLIDRLANMEAVIPFDGLNSVRYVHRAAQPIAVSADGRGLAWHHQVELLPPAVLGPAVARAETGAA